MGEFEDQLATFNKAHKELKDAVNKGIYMNSIEYMARVYVWERETLARVNPVQIYFENPEYDKYMDVRFNEDSTKEEVDKARAIYVTYLKSIHAYEVLDEFVEVDTLEMKEISEQRGYDG